jgi:hypothetical protein
MASIAARPSPPASAFVWLAAGIVIAQVDVHLNAFDVDVVIVWGACTGVVGAAARAGASDLAAVGRRRRGPIVAASLVWLLSPVLGPVLVRLPLGVAAALVIGYAVFAVAALLLFVGLLRRAGRSLGGEAVPV